MSVIELSGLIHRLENKATGEHFTISVPQDIVLESRDFVGLLGPSGCGKTTLLTLLGLLRGPSDSAALEKFLIHVPSDTTDSRVAIDLKKAWQKKQYGLIENIRRQHFGFALQSGELINSLTVGENIGSPLKVNEWSKSQVTQRVEELMQQFRLFRGSASSESKQGVSLANSRVNRLSGGEHQRVALARAIAHRPSIVFVDEPTSALNRELAYGALETLKHNQVSEGVAGVTFMITHDEHLADDFCNVIIKMAPCQGKPAGEVVEVIRHDRKVGSSESS